MEHGKFVISLDFELMWGVFDNRDIDNYGQNIQGVKKVIPRLLEMFEKYDVSCTFAIVGFLFHKDKQSLMSYLPYEKPLYSDKTLNAYEYLNNLTTTISEYCFNYRLVEMIKQYPRHEIATHTYSHYYCMEDGQNSEHFKNDLSMAIKVAQLHNINLKSIVFPRNQIVSEYLKICSDLGVNNYRGNEKAFFYKGKTKNDQSPIVRILRLLDAYFNISGHHCFLPYKDKELNIYNIPSSRLLRSYNPRLRWLEKLKLRRIKKSMEYAAKNNLVYHLWWHPHNFGVHQKENLALLTSILEYYNELRGKYNFLSFRMDNVVNRIGNEGICEEPR